jgi:hypothetical protein
MGFVITTGNAQPGRYVLETATFLFELFLLDGRQVPDIIKEIIGERTCLPD